MSEGNECEEYLLALSREAKLLGHGQDRHDGHAVDYLMRVVEAGTQNTANQHFRYGQGWSREGE